jgi:hypothetical protein
VRDTGGTDVKNPFDFDYVRGRIETGLREFEGRFVIIQVPNITNIFYGRDVGYAIERIDLDATLQAVSATDARARMFPAYWRPRAADDRSRDAWGHLMIVAGIHLPDSDTHFGPILEASERVDGKGTYQLAKLRRAVALVQHKGHAVDVGAQVGLWTRVLAREFQFVTAFEPVPRVCRLPWPQLR